MSGLKQGRIQAQPKSPAGRLRENSTETRPHRGFVPMTVGHNLPMAEGIREAEWVLLCP